MQLVHVILVTSTADNNFSTTVTLRFAFFICGLVWWSYRPTQSLAIAHQQLQPLTKHHKIFQHTRTQHTRKQLKIVDQRLRHRREAKCELPNILNADADISVWECKASEIVVIANACCYSHDNGAGLWQFTAQRLYRVVEVRIHRHRFPNSTLQTKEQLSHRSGRQKRRFDTNRNK